MKKIIVLLLASLMTIGLLSACGEKKPDDSETNTTTMNVVGDTIETKNYRITLKDARLTDKILVCYGDDAHKSTFINAEEFFTATDEPFVDEDGYVIEGIHGFSASKTPTTFIYTIIMNLLL